MNVSRKIKGTDLLKIFNMILLQITLGEGGGALKGISF